jgi:hypothetical protein
VGLAIDTFAGSALNPGAAGAAVVIAQGDTNVVRNFNQAAGAQLMKIIRGGATAGFVRVRSPLLHDPVQGIRFFTSQTPSMFLFPQETGQTLRASDTLTVEVSGGAAETDVVGVQVYYKDLPGSAARLHSWGEISGNIKNIKPVVVAVATGAVGTWADTLITATENLLHANTDYAVLGYVVDVATAIVGFKGTDTGNFRICGPGSTDASDTADFFIQRSLREGLPYIPVFNAANAGATFVSTFHNGGTQNVNVSLVLAELTQNLAN